MPEATVESDYFTAMDDLLGGGKMEDQGAGMVGDTDYTAACYYHYASLDTDALLENLKDSPDVQELVKRAVPALLRAMFFTNPGGKQNSFAGHILPSAVLVECKEVKIPTSLVNAFVKPVTGADLVEESMKKLTAEADMTARNYGLPVKERLWFRADKYDVKPESATCVCASLGELVDAVAHALD